MTSEKTTQAKPTTAPKPFRFSVPNWKLLGDLLHRMAAFRLEAEDADGRVSVRLWEPRWKQNGPRELLTMAALKERVGQVATPGSADEIREED